MGDTLTEEALECWYWLKENYSKLFIEFQDQLEEEE
jgi:hypothetical protein